MVWFLLNRKCPSGFRLGSGALAPRQLTVSRHIWSTLGLTPTSFERVTTGLTVVWQGTSLCTRLPRPRGMVALHETP